MNMIEISLDENYCPEWKTWEGIRELIQNYMDAADGGCPGTVNHYENQLVIYNEGADITLAQMALFGATTKLNNDAMRGQFGEGFKIGLLALVRDGHDVIVRTPRGTFTPQIIESKSYQARVLAFSCVDENQSDGVEVRVLGIPEGLWAQYQNRFLWDSQRNAVLPDRPGHVFVRDIWVGEFSDYQLGYNFADIQTDRDRKLVDPWTLKLAASALVATAVGNDSMPAENALDLVMRDTEDTKHLHTHITRKGRGKIAAAFKDRYGDNAIAVNSVDNVRAAEHHGLQPVVAPLVAVDLLDESNRVAYRLCELRSNVEIEDLAEDEQLRLQWAINLVVNRAGAPETTVRVVDFIQNDVLGRREGDAIYIARKVLVDEALTLSTVVEEFAHAEGGDGSRAHKEEIHRIYSRIICDELS